MSIDFFIGAKRVLSLSETSLLPLGKAQEMLRQKTGQEIDLYGKTILYPEHAKLWCVGLYQLLPQLEIGSSVKQVCLSLISMIENAIKNNQIIKIEGE